MGALYVLFGSNLVTAVLYIIGGHITMAYTCMPGSLTIILLIRS